jgi:hypothetical protein
VFVIKIDDSLTLTFFCTPIRHRPIDGSLTQPNPTQLDELDFGDVYSNNDAASLAPLVLKLGCSEEESLIGRPWTVEAAASLSSDFGCSVLFQQENENLRLRSSGCSGFCNELFNRTGIVETFTIEDITAPVVVVLIPKAITQGELRGASSIGNRRGAATSDLSLTSLREFQGAVSFVIRDVSGRQIGSASTLPLKGRLCCSAMSLDRNELAFDDCEPNQTYVKEFSVWNRSEISLAFHLGVSANDGVLECWNYDTNTEGSGQSVVPAYDHRRVQVRFKPTQIGERNFQLYLENKNNPENFLTVDIATSVTKEPREKLLLVTSDQGDPIPSDGLLQLGDCYTGVAVRRILRVQNLSDGILDLLLTSDHPDEVTFASEASIGRPLHFNSKNRAGGRGDDGTTFTEEPRVGDDDHDHDETDGPRSSWAASRSLSVGDSAINAADIDDDEEEQEDDDDGCDIQQLEKGRQTDGEEDVDDDDDDDDDDDEPSASAASSADLVHRKQRSAAFTSPSKIKAQGRGYGTALADGAVESDRQTVVTDSTRVEEILLQPRQEVRVIIRLCPLRQRRVGDLSHDPGSLAKWAFKILFTSRQHDVDHWNQTATTSKALLGAFDDDGDGDTRGPRGGDVSSKAMQRLDALAGATGTASWKYVIGCRARVAESIIDVSPALLDVGDSNIGA